MENSIIEERKMSATKKVLYTGSTHTTGGREGGQSKSSDGNLDITLSAPGKGKGTNPEQLFAAGWSACFIGAMRIAAGQMKVRFPKNASVDTEIDLVLTGESYSLRARLHINLPGLDADTARAIVNTAHDTCPYSKATRGNIEVEKKVTTSL